MVREKPLWEKAFLGAWSKSYIRAVQVIGYKGCTIAEYDRAAAKLPDHDKWRYESIARELTGWQKREQEKRYELNPTARKVFRIILGPAPEDPEYASWWKARLVSVRDMRERGLPVEWAEEPPVPLEEEKPRKEPKATKPAKEKEPKAEKPKPKKGPAKK